MTLWIIEPRDPFIARDGKPFGAIPGARAASLPFPFPSTTTGGVRTRAGLDQNGLFASTPEESRKIAVAGPLLVELNESGDLSDWLFPAPTDALLLETEPRDEAMARCKRLLPRTLPPGRFTDLEDLAVIHLEKPDLEASKPARQLRFWYWKRLEQWLTKPEAESTVMFSELGHDGPLSEFRTHVRLDPQTLTADEGKLFQTRGLEFARDTKRLALAVLTDASLKRGIAPLGGERRLVMWRESRASAFPKTCPDSIREAIRRDKRCRVVLATPAFFRNGYRPEWMCSEREGVKSKLAAIACGRYQTVSGWNLDASKNDGRGEPKHSNRLAPAGSVYFLSLETTAETKIDAWIDATWMRCVSDAEQWRLDGFGLALLGSDLS